MFIAMNRFQVAKSRESEFESVWKSLDSHLDKVPGFIDFRLLRGSEHENYTLYSSHTVWSSRHAFEDWTRSEHFRTAHRDVGEIKGLYLDHPKFEGFDIVI